MISNRPQNYKKTGVFIQKHAKHTRISAIFHENERETPVSRHFSARSTRTMAVLWWFQSKQMHP